jgi:hypothetical protein
MRLGSWGGCIVSDIFGISFEMKLKTILNKESFLE